MHVVLSSIFRNSTSYLYRWVNQVSGLYAALQQAGHSLEILVVEGDSDDDTQTVLHLELDMFTTVNRIPARLVKRDHGGPVFGSVDDAQRWRNISHACNGIFENLPAGFDALIYVESDLIWQASTMLALLADLTHVPAVSPLSLYDRDKFYDVWGYRRGRLRFQTNYPYHPDLLGPAEVAHRLYEIDSAGSCIVMRAEVARSARFEYPEIGIVGFCQSIYDHGGALYLDPLEHVAHPWP